MEINHRWKRPAKTIFTNMPWQEEGAVFFFLRAPSPWQRHPLDGFVIERLRRLVTQEIQIRQSECVCAFYYSRGAIQVHLNIDLKSNKH